jgi:hypothetical protein
MPSKGLRTAASRRAAVELAKAMIADGRMPTPEQAKAQYEEAAAKRKAQRDRAASHALSGQCTG